MIAIVILAAGSSRRLGRPKQMELLAGETLLARAVRTATASGLGEVLVVVSATEPAVMAEAQRLRCEVVINEAAAEGMASSIRIAVRALPEAATGMLVMTCDQPAVSAEHLRVLVGEGGEVVASAYAERRGVPAYFTTQCFAELVNLRGDVGARELLQKSRAVDLEHGEVDVDTDAELERARMLFGRGRA